MAAAQADYKYFPYGDLQELIPGFWQVTGSLPFPLKRNMIVVRLPDGGLLIHSAVAMHDVDMKKLETLGKPSVLVVPIAGHRMDARFYKERYPKIKVMAPAQCKAKVEEVVQLDATCEEGLAPYNIQCHPVGGVKNGELVFEVPVSPTTRALMFTDTISTGGLPGGLKNLPMRLLGPKGNQLGMPRIVQWNFLRDKQAYAKFLHKMADLPGVVLVTVSHGGYLKSECASQLREAAGRV